MDGSVFHTPGDAITVVEAERRRINEMTTEHELLEQVRFLSGRRQVQSAIGGALIGFAIIRAADLDLIPEGKEEYKDYCKTRFGYSPSQIRSFRKLAADWQASVAAQEFVIQNRAELQAGDEEIKLPEAGSLTSMTKALKAKEAFDQGLAMNNDHEHAMYRAREIYAPKAQSEHNSSKERYQILLGLFFSILSRHPELIDEVVMNIAGEECDCSSMQNFDESIKIMFLPMPIINFCEKSYSVPVGELRPPWRNSPPSKPKGASHNKTSDADREAYQEAIVNQMSNGLSFAQACKEANVPKSTAQGWIKANPDFAGLVAAMRTKD